MIDPKKLLDDFLGAADGSRAGSQSISARSGLPGGLAAAGAGAGLIGLLLGSKKGRRIGASVLGYGGAAVLGGLAYKAWQEWTEKRAPSPARTSPDQELPTPPADSGFDLESEISATGADARIAIVQAMIAAAKADGHIDADEQRKLFERIGQLELDREEKALVMDELAKPLDVDEIAALARSQEQATEIWLASRLAIDPDDPKERTYLEELGRKLSLPDSLIVHLEAQATAVRAA